MYDGTTNEARLNRELLCQELRQNPPEDWYYPDPRRCALAVGVRLFGPGYNPTTVLGMNGRDACHVFMYPGVNPSPAQVADAIEAAPYV